MELLVQLTEIQDIHNNCLNIPTENISQVIRAQVRTVLTDVQLIVIFIKYMFNKTEKTLVVYHLINEYKCIKASMRSDLV